jgi:hypothetical protein
MLPQQLDYIAAKGIHPYLQAYQLNLSTLRIIVLLFAEIVDPRGDFLGEDWLSSVSDLYSHSALAAD